MNALLEVRDLRISFFSKKEKKIVLDDLNFSLNEGDKVGLVGESGSGKTVLAQSLILPTGIIEKGEIWFEGENLLSKSPAQMRRVRGKKIGFIFQDSTAALNPTMKIGHQIREVILEHENLKKKEAREHTLELLQRVGLTPPMLRYHQYPFEFSGGMRQRAMIAIAIACSPSLIIADEPTTALDVTIQAQIIELFQKLDLHAALLFITHDLGLVAGLCNKVMIMKGGSLVEQGAVEQVFYKSHHPYTRHLLTQRRML